ncbi:MAG TPA: winged helix-turn-helix transcriptional regulator [Candidatus Acidoferrum sp.]|nr:winged helix-turn-helix transcriptional regulator [Candidatus Acidoferrum sp.]
MVKRAYGQYCGFARALEVVGERWALMIVRDLLVGSKRFSDLLRGLPGIPTNILTARLKELEEAGIVQRRAVPRPGSGVAYELTDAGSALEATVLALGRWGAERLDTPREGEIVTDDSLAMALRTTFRPEAAGKSKASYVVRAGNVEIHAIVQDGNVKVGRGALPDPDLIIESGPALRALLAGETAPEEALRKKLVRIQGDPRLLDRFVRIFRI